MTALLAALPIVVVLVLMVGRRWAASRAGLVGAALALVIAVAAFDLGRGVPLDAPGGAAYVGTFAEALFTAATILWIVIPALAIHHLQVATGATDRLRLALAGIASDPRLFALLIGWFFALFIEGAAGFGASVALAAPFLVGVGYRPLDAVVVAMLGHAIGVSFGAIGTPLVPQVAATGLSPLEIAAPTARLHLIAGWLLLAAMMLVASRAVGRPARGAIWGWTALAGAAFLVPYWLIATFVGPELPTLAGSLIGIAVFVAALKLFGRQQAPGVVPDLPAAAPTGAVDLLRAGAPYLVLIVLVLLTRLVPPIRDPLGAVEVAWTLPGGFTGSFRPLTHPGTLLAVSFLVGAALARAGGSRIGAALRTTFGQLAAVAVALVAMLSLARIMVHAGMTQSLAEAAAAGAGDAWPVMAPLVGVLGTFVTGSATASNVLFTDLQVATAETLSLPIPPMVAGQGYGAAVGNVVCPHNIVAAGATVGLTGGEGDVLRRTIGPALAYSLVGGVLLLTMT
ncbi:MAG TPA: L-lactate permease [Egicoccus sp.]|nr:L-lactate permease [Egicoccus sp.]HSK22520.1 L-lactate permease [Egicoccus sp.]